MDASTARPNPGHAAISDTSHPGDGPRGGGCPAFASEGAEGPADTLYYWDYLDLDRLLQAQRPKSAAAGDPQHDEHLFICVHQTAELWFKQILVELESVLAIFDRLGGAEESLPSVLARLERIDQIVRLLIVHLDVLETMTPLDFLDFRGFLVPASGFQSVQFRLIENRLGLRGDDRLRVEGQCYAATLRSDHAARVEDSEAVPSLLDRVESWLAAFPHVRTAAFDFPATYRQAVVALHEGERARIADGLAGQDVLRRKRLKGFDSGARKFEAVLDRAGWDADVARGRRRLSYDAFMAALFITSYRDEARLHLPSRVLTALVDIDESFTVWRQRHALLAHRMLGRQTGTAGSGYAYLDETAKRYKVFKDLFDISTYLVPRSALPPLPTDARHALGFRHAS